ncbi:unnamed protein product [Ambrosiozyma monospora]|uniref:Unnamed protein product n=1 Tax=Ambrosiozyma monospora TaxID=43982 RepID=A0A9W6YZA4_AMBMO|nr:unnamed protein product [Ambrosiozyma monospora]
MSSQPKTSQAKLTPSGSSDHALKFLTEQIEAYKLSTNAKTNQLLLTQTLLVLRLKGHAFEKTKIINEVTKHVQTLSRKIKDPMQFFMYWLELSEYLKDNGYAKIVDKFDKSDFTKMDDEDEVFLCDIIKRTTDKSLIYYIRWNSLCPPDMKVSYLQVLHNIKKDLEIGYNMDETFFKGLFSMIRFQSYDVMEAVFHVKIIKLFMDKRKVKVSEADIIKVLLNSCFTGELADFPEKVDARWYCRKRAGFPEKVDARLLKIKEDFFNDVKSYDFIQSLDKFIKLVEFYVKEQLIIRSSFNEAPF